MYALTLFFHIVLLGINILQVFQPLCSFVFVYFFDFLFFLQFLYVVLLFRFCNIFLEFFVKILEYVFFFLFDLFKVWLYNIASNRIIGIFVYFFFRFDVHCCFRRIVYYFDLHNWFFCNRGSFLFLYLWSIIDQIYFCVGYSFFRINDWFFNYFFFLLFYLNWNRFRYNNFFFFWDNIHFWLLRDTFFCFLGQTLELLITHKLLFVLWHQFVISLDELLLAIPVQFNFNWIYHHSYRNNAIVPNDRYKRNNYDRLWNTFSRSLLQRIPMLQNNLRLVDIENAQIELVEDSVITYDV